MRHRPQGNHVYVDSMRTIFNDLGLMEYNKVHESQLKCVEQLLTIEDASEQIFLTEHHSVFTLGRQGKLDALIRSREEIHAENIQIIHTERGGDITFHGPGQLVVYPVINLRKRSMTVSHYVHLLEEIMLKTVGDFGLAANRDERNRGIWVGDCKIGSIGIRIRHGISFHGLSLNVNLSLDPFTWVQPCGLMGVGVTSMQKELQSEIPMENVKVRIKEYLQNYLCLE